MDASRRQLMVNGAAMAGAALLASRGTAAVAERQPSDAAENLAANKPAGPQEAQPPGQPGTDYTPVVVPNGWTLPFKVVDGVKVFHLVAEEVYHEFALASVPTAGVQRVRTRPGD